MDQVVVSEWLTTCLTGHCRVESVVPVQILMRELLKDILLARCFLWWRSANYRLYNQFRIEERSVPNYSTKKLSDNLLREERRDDWWWSERTHSIKQWLYWSGLSTWLENDKKRLEAIGIAWNDGKRHEKTEKDRNEGNYKLWESQKRLPGSQVLFNICNYRLSMTHAL